MLQERVLRTFEEGLKFGADAEHVIGQELIRRGCAIMPLYQFETVKTAPALFSNNHSITLPDLMVWNTQKQCFFVECKRKTRWVPWQNHLETGFNDRLMHEYARVQTVTGHKVWIVFIHEEQEPGWYHITLDRFHEHSRLWDGLNCKYGTRISPPMRLVRREFLHRYDARR